jgi:ABC-type nitrate/sulfonate/bicarbonate transport system permease component
VAERRGRGTTAARVRRTAAVVGALAAWQLLATTANSPLLPTLDDTIRRLVNDTAAGLVTEHAVTTVTRGFIGFGLALAIGVLLGVLMGRSRTAEAMFEPVLGATYAIPKLALFPIFILLFGFGGPSKIALVALECAYPIAYNTYEGVRSTSKQLVWVARNAGAGRLATSAIMLRSALPAILAGVRIALPIMLVIMTVTELLGESRGLGFLIRSAGANFEPDGALAIVLLLGVLGFVLDRLIVALTRVLVFWQKGARA